MSKDDFKHWYVEGLQALLTASEHGREAAGDTLKAVTASEVKRVIEADTDLTEDHAKRLDALLREAGATPSGMPNKIIEGIRAGDRQVIEAANDPQVRDASIVASAQIALHYFIAAFGTLASNARHLGMDEAARTLKRMAEETKEQDQRLTQLAEDLANERAA